MGRNITGKATPTEALKGTGFFKENVTSVITSNGQYHGLVLPDYLVRLRFLWNSMVLK